MSRIGSLGQFKLSVVLQRLEAHEKTGLLTVKQGSLWVDLYFRDGQLLFIGPVRADASLIDRLLYDGVISSQVYQEVLHIVGADQKSEIPFAQALMEHHYVTHEQLRTWATKKALEVFQALLCWPEGELYFEEETAPPPERLRVRLSVSSLLAAIPESLRSTQPAAIPAATAQPSQPATDAPWLLDEAQTPKATPVTPAPRPYVTRIPTLTQPSQFYGDAAPPAAFLPSSDIAPVIEPASIPVAMPPSTEKIHASASFSPQTDAGAHEDQSITAGRLPALSSSKMNVPSGQLSAAALIDQQAPPQQLMAEVPGPEVLVEAEQKAPSGQLSAAALIDQQALPQQLVAEAPEAPVNLQGMERMAGTVSTSSPAVPAPSAVPLPSKYVDIAAIRPEMVMVPVDLSAFRESQASVLITPDHWRLLMKVDGQTTLQGVSMELGIAPEMLCRLVADLVSQNLIDLTLPANMYSTPAMEERLPVAREAMMPALGNGFVAPGYAATPTSPWSMPAAPFLAPPAGTPASAPEAVPLPFETESQWGNGGNGATFVPGRGWVARSSASSPMQTMQQAQHGAGGSDAAMYPDMGLFAHAGSSY
ncbi:MAG: DUF4388 domain-containing protein [Ktedonobacteraceae bacterium]|nr:DUF4388 domain-containing protein [Ktedonobacteraceae bacterium]